MTPQPEGEKKPSPTDSWAFFAKALLAFLLTGAAALAGWTLLNGYSSETWVAGWIGGMIGTVLWATATYDGEWTTGGD